MSNDTLANRIVRLLSANGHAMLDSLEGRNPEAMMNQFIRELDEAIDEVATEFGRAEAAKHLATASIARQNNEIVTLAERIELAVKEGSDAAASAGIARQLDLEDTISALHRSLDDAAGKAVEHERTLLGLRAKRREMEAAVQAFLAAQAKHAADEANGPGSGSGIRSDTAGSRDKADKAEAGFNRIMARSTGVVGTVTNSDADPSQLKALETMQRNHRIAERLARIKAGGSAAGSGD